MFNNNLLYEESLGFIPGNHRGIQDPKYVFAKFQKNCKDFDYTNKDFLQIREEVDLLKYLQLLDIKTQQKY